MIDAGKGSFELTGLTDEEVIGRPVKEVLGLRWLAPGDGGKTADIDGDGTTTRSRHLWSGECARSASESR